jgi:hypothetical protein
MSGLPSLVASGIVVCLALLAAAAVALVAGAVRRGGRREDAIERDDALAASRFTIPVSVVIAAPVESPEVQRCIESVLSLTYPEFEVIVVTAHDTTEHWETLKREWTLEPREFFYRRVLSTAPVRRIFGSSRDPRLIVIDKEPAHPGDSLNCGLNLARFRYVACLSPEVVLDCDGLLRMMGPVLRDPANVIAAISHVEARSAEGTGLIAVCQRIDSIRSWMTSRLSWNRLRCGLRPRHGLVAWRRDTILEAGGFSTTARDPELDLLVRLQCAAATSDGVRRNPDIVGRVEPIGLGAAGRVAADRQHSLLQALGAAMPRGFRHAAVFCFFLAEFAIPLMQAAVFGAAVLGAFAGWFSWTSVALVVALLAVGNAMVTSAALLLRGAAPWAPALTESARVLLVAPAEYAIYRPAVFLSRLAAIFAPRPR